MILTQQNMQEVRKFQDGGHKSSGKTVQIPMILESGSVHGLIINKTRRDFQKNILVPQLEISKEMNIHSGF